ncbi:MAG: hypothetical protein ACEPOZ_20965 [Marinifilaceae bacterium]
MGMFDGIEILFFMLGVITTLAVVGMVYLAQKYKLNWKMYATAVTGIFLGIFAIAWSVSSVLEGEPRAASMGMVVFGLPSLAFLGLFRRVLLAGNKKA